jgi:hypothetical protein
MPASFFGAAMIPATCVPCPYSSAPDPARFAT